MTGHFTSCTCQGIQSGTWPCLIHTPEAFAVARDPIHDTGDDGYHGGNPFPPRAASIQAAMSILRVQPGDTLLISVPPLTAEENRRLQDAISASMPDQKVLLICDPAKLYVMRGGVEACPESIMPEPSIVVDI